MSTRAIVSIALAALGFAAVWMARSPSPPSYAHIVEIREKAAVQRATAAADTVHLVRWETRRDTLRDTLRLTDTLQVLRYLEVSDSTLFACRAALGSCWDLNGSLDSAITAQQRYIEKQDPPRKTWLRWGERLAWGPLGYSLRNITP